MDDPVSEIPTVISLLTETRPSVQAAAVEKYFTANAAFTHPFCRTGSFSSSRYLIQRIYRWYKILSPRISLTVHSVSLDKANNVLYVGITQVFAIWLIPTHRSEVSLVTVLHLERDDVDRGEGDGGRATGKWYISSQNDLYQTDQFLKFVLPWLAWVIPLWQLVATLVCVVCSYVFAPVTWWEETQQVHYKRPEKPPAWKDAK